MSQSIPSIVEVGTNVILKAKVSCPSGCDLRGEPIEIMIGDNVTTMSELETFHEKTNETGLFRLRAPVGVGEYVLCVLFPGCETESAVHDKSSLATTFLTKPHVTSMAVWDTPSPVVMNSSFTVKIGIKCSAMCQLAGHNVAVHNEVGTQIGRGVLGEATWPGTDSLYWAEVQLAAPSTKNVASWTVTFATTGLMLPHETVPTALTFRTVKPPENRITVRIIDGKTDLPVEDVEVRLGVYQAFTDTQGLANVEVPKDTYILTIRKDGYTAPPTTLEVIENVAVQVRASSAPTGAEVEERMMRFEDYPWG